MSSKNNLINIEFDHNHTINCIQLKKPRGGAPNKLISFLTYTPSEYIKNNYEYNPLEIAFCREENLEVFQTDAFETQKLDYLAPHRWDDLMYELSNTDIIDFLCAYVNKDFNFSKKFLIPSFVPFKEGSTSIVPAVKVKLEDVFFSSDIFNQLNKKIAAMPFNKAAMQNILVEHCSTPKNRFAGKGFRNYLTIAYLRFCIKKEQVVLRDSHLIDEFFESLSELTAKIYPDGIKLLESGFVSSVNGRQNLHAIPHNKAVKCIEDATDLKRKVFDNSEGKQVAYKIIKKYLTTC